MTDLTIVIIRGYHYPVVYTSRFIPDCELSNILHCKKNYGKLWYAQTRWCSTSKQRMGRIE